MHRDTVPLHGPHICPFWLCAILVAGLRHVLRAVGCIPALHGVPAGTIIKPSKCQLIFLSSQLLLYDGDM